MKQYELTVVIHPDMEVNITPAVDKVKKLIDDNGGTIIKETNEGKKHLAYEIGKQEFAIYYYFELDLPADAPGKISNVLNITDEVIRYLLVRTDPRKAKMEARRKAGRGGEKGEDADDSNDNTDDERVDSKKNTENIDTKNESTEDTESAENSEGKDNSKDNDNKDKGAEGADNEAGADEAAAEKKED